MLRYVEEHFAGKRAALQVVTTMMRLGIRVDKQGRLYCDTIEIAPAKMARALGVDRRVVIETAKEIAANPELLPVFSDLAPIANVSKAAKFFGHDVLEINADPNTVGLVSKVSGVLERYKVGIRQIITDDPDLYPEPKMLVVVDGKLPQKAVSELRKLHLQSISLK